MREYSVPSNYSVDDSASVAAMVFSHAESYPDTVMFQRRVGGEWTDVTAAEFAVQVTAVAKGLMASGVQKGDRVGLLSATRYEWELIDFAIWTAGAVTVPIYETSSADQVQWILSDSAAVGIVCENAKHRAMLNTIEAECPDLAHTWQIEGTEAHVLEGSGSAAVEALTQAGAGITDDELHARRREVVADDMATLIYTSGTTGRPKGCILTHRNLLAESDSATSVFAKLMHPGQRTLLFLPLAHVFARVIAVASFEKRVVLGHTADVKNLVNDLGVFKPDFVLSVPRVFEKVYNTARQKAHSGGSLKGKIFEAADATAVAYSEAQYTGGPSLALTVRHAVFDKLVYAKLKAALGGRCNAAIVGGAPLGARLGHFFSGVGVPVYEGYGLTETTAALTANGPGAQKMGTVGRPIPGCAVRVAEDEEILATGDVVFSGYWHNEQATKDTFVDGWFRTGDLGSLDSDGYLTITGRKKELIVTAGGKNVAPAVLEDKLRQHPLISQCMVVGDQKPFIGALITIDPEAFPDWLKAHGKPADTDVASLVEDVQLLADIEGAVTNANKAVSHAEAIKKFRILPVDFTEDTGELTPTLKLKRNVVAKSFATDIESIYTT
ncbi:long-chain fatty acid--CoA ligase [Rhodococcus sp. X156]|uniref:AMP-dependent synthetase/ligase n=1 Tax=Rhodococcus sp. X156 TaxID=2499145 RepID=UPI000FDB20AB|nr:long-chain fatty acid--CoA ligase [Rhodococcus sp. X156]